MSSRVKNASRNAIFGIVLKMYQIIVPFILRTVMIYFLGVEYVGLSSLFVSILSVLNLAELGVGSALVFSMYKPIIEDDTSKICELLNLYRRYYRIIGFVILLFGLALLPFLSYLIKSDIPNDINLYLIYFLNLLITVLSYWLFAYRSSILQANQRNDVISKITLVSSTIQYLFQFFALILFRDYYLYIICNLFAQVLNNIFIYCFTKKMYINYKPYGNLPKDEIDRINNRVKDLFTSKLGGVVVNSADSIVISAFLGLTTLALYQNYYYILSAVLSFIFVIYTSCTASLGNSLITESKEKNYSDFKVLSFLIFWISCVCVTCLLCLYQPFMSLWLGNKYLLSFNTVICICAYFYIFNFNQFLCLYKDAAGIWHSDRYRPLITSAVNLIFNLITVKYIGLYGVILSTVISTLFIGAPWLVFNVFSRIFDKSNIRGYIRIVFKYVMITILSCGLSLLFCNLFTNNLVGFVCKLFISFLISNILFILLNLKNCEFSKSLKLIKKFLKKKRVI